MNQEDNQTVEPEGAEDLPGGSTPGGAQTRPEAQAQGDAAPASGAPEGDPMVDEPSQGEKGGARAERDAAQGVPDTPATQAEGGTGDADSDG